MLRDLGVTDLPPSFVFLYWDRGAEFVVLIKSLMQPESVWKFMKSKEPREGRLLPIIHYVLGAGLKVLFW